MYYFVLCGEISDVTVPTTCMKVIYIDEIVCMVFKLPRTYTYDTEERINLRS